MRPCLRMIGIVALAVQLSGCLIEIPDNDYSRATATWFPQLGTDERDFNSTCLHFGNQHALSYPQPYTRC